VRSIKEKKREYKEQCVVKKREENEKWEKSDGGEK